MKPRQLLQLCAMLSLATPSVFADGDKTIWQPGNTYHTHISYKIIIENAELEPGADKSYSGRYSAPKLMFWPVIEFTTSDIIKRGRDYYAQRQYMPGYQTVSGLDGLKWKSDNWMINPKRWWRAVCRYRDKDFVPMRNEVKNTKDAQRKAEQVDKEVMAAEKEVDAIQKILDTELADAKEELAKLSSSVDSSKSDSEKHAKAEEKLAKAVSKREKKEQKIRERLAEARKRLKSAREAADTIRRTGLPCEQFDIFYDTEHNAVQFSPETQRLFLKWDEKSIDNYIKNGSHKNALELRIGSVELRVEDALSNGWNALSKPGSPSVNETISSEFGVTASVIFDDPNGKFRLLEKERENWTIDASAINGLLATDALKKLICFKGTLNVERSPVRPTDCEKVGLDPFVGLKVQVVDANDAEMGYDTGEGYQPFPIAFSQNGKNKIEFWFDSNNEILRYAHIVIEKENYEGNIPNPNLGKTLSQIKGMASGNAKFECEYTTSINQKLRNIDEEESKSDK